METELTILLVISAIAIVIQLFILFKKDDNSDCDCDCNIDVDTINKTDSISELRKMVDIVDLSIIRSINERSLIVKRMWDIKRQLGMPIFDKKREDDILKKMRAHAKKLGMNEDKVVTLHSNIVGGHFH